MPTELRTIVFSNAELMEAVDSFPQRKKQLPDGPVRSARVYQKLTSGVRVVVDIESGGPDRLRRFALDTPFVARVLLEYCNGRNIPLARTGEKFIEMIGDNIAVSQKMRSQEVFPEEPKQEVEEIDHK